MYTFVLILEKKQLGSFFNLKQATRFLWIGCLFSENNKLGCVFDHKLSVECV